MFEPKLLSHDEAVDWLLEVRNVEISAVSNAFLASLSRRRLDWRSALGSYAFARHFPAHEANFFSDNQAKICKICGHISTRNNTEREDLNVLNFERHKWGGVRHLDPIYAAFDLERFAVTKIESCDTRDIEILRQIIQIARQMETTATAGDFSRQVGRQLKGIFSSNEDERRTLIQILGICGIFQPRDQASFFSDYVNEWERKAPLHHKSDWEYPVSHWCGADGVNQEALNFYFPQLMN